MRTPIVFLAALFIQACYHSNDDTAETTQPETSHFSYSLNEDVESTLNAQGDNPFMISWLSDQNFTSVLVESNIEDKSSRFKLEITVPGDQLKVYTIDDGIDAELELAETVYLLDTSSQSQIELKAIPPVGGKINGSLNLSFSCAFSGNFCPDTQSMTLQGKFDIIRISQ